MLCRLIVMVILLRPAKSIAPIHASRRVAEHEAARARWFAFALLNVPCKLAG
jgi:hypothetical protein